MAPVGEGRGWTLTPILGVIIPRGPEEGSDSRLTGRKGRRKDRRKEAGRREGARREEAGRHQCKDPRSHFTGHLLEPGDVHSFLPEVFTVTWRGREPSLNGHGLELHTHSSALSNISVISQMSK